MQADFEGRTAGGKTGPERFLGRFPAHWRIVEKRSLDKTKFYAKIKNSFTKKISQKKFHKTDESQKVKKEKAWKVSVEAYFPSETGSHRLKAPLVQISF